MTDPQQKPSGAAAPAAETGREMDVSRPEGTGPMVLDQPSAAKERCQSQLADLDHAVEGINQELGQIASRMEGVADAKVMEGLRSRRRQLTQRREDLLLERPMWARKLDAIAREEQQAVVTLHLAARRNAHHEGVAIADRLRSALGVVGGLYQAWREWAETDRRLKDTLRSLAPDRMTEVPEFSYATAMDAAFQQAIALALGELQKSKKELQRRSAA